MEEWRAIYEGREVSVLIKGPQAGLLSAHRLETGLEVPKCSVGLQKDEERELPFWKKINPITKLSSFAAKAVAIALPSAVVMALVLLHFFQPSILELYW